MMLCFSLSRCVNEDSCKSLWLQQSSDQNVCLYFDQTIPLQGTCHFCCTTDNCNSNIKPDADLYAGKHWHQLVPRKALGILCNSQPVQLYITIWSKAYNSGVVVSKIVYAWNTLWIDIVNVMIMTTTLKNIPLWGILSFDLMAKCDEFCRNNYLIWQPTSDINGIL